MNKCTKKNCPMNAETLNPDCNLKGCPYRTEIRRNRMPNSLITKLSKLRYQGEITVEEYKYLIDKLKGNDEAIIAQIMWERDIAIEQLKLLGYGLGEKIEPCEGYISRKMAIEAIEEIQPIDTEYDCTLYDEVDVMYILHSLPPAKPQRPKGEWIVLREEYEFMGSIVNEPRGCKCSNCNKVVRFKSDFCPNCGADMRESEGEDETDN